MYLSRAEQQMVEIAKAFRTKPAIMIFDEPTASLTERETDRLFELMKQIKAEGIGIIYITHRMNEIKRIGDRITVLRDGLYVDTIPVAEATDQKLVELMTGRVIDRIFPAIKRNPTDMLLEVDGLITAKQVVNDASITVRRGEVVGLAGLVGSGKSTVGRACFGIERITAGSIKFDGEVIYDRARGVNKLSPRRMLDRGFYYLPPDRRKEGLMMLSSVRENVSLASLSLSTFSNWLLLRRGNERTVVKDIAGKLDLVPLNIERNLEHFSGGNQQKVLVGKSLVRDVKLFVFDEPTVGVDVGARVAMYEFIRDLCEAGAGVLLISFGSAGNPASHSSHLRDASRRASRGAGQGGNLGGNGAEPLLREEKRSCDWEVEVMADIASERPTLLERAEYFATLIFVRAGVLPWFLIIAIIVFSITTDNFATSRNVMSVLRQATYLVMVAMGQMVVLLTAGLDLSVGVMFAITSVISSMVMVNVWGGEGGVAIPILIGCLAGFGAGTGIGVINGVGVAIFRVPPFMMTLAMASIVFGIALTITGGTPIYGMPGRIRQHPRLRQAARHADADLDYHRLHHPDVRLPELDPHGALPLCTWAAI